MGADFSRFLTFPAIFPSSVTTTSITDASHHTTTTHSKSTPLRRRSSAFTALLSNANNIKNNRNKPHKSLFDDTTVANTLKNRSHTPVSRHVALARLASRLACAGRRQRAHIIRMLGLSPRAVEHLRRFSPSNVFVDAAHCIDEIQFDSTYKNKKDFHCGIGAGNSCRHGTDFNIGRAQKKSSKTKSVSFAPTAELLFIMA